MTKKLMAANWNKAEDNYTLEFWNQNIMQFWTDDEIPLSDDKMSWVTLTAEEKNLYTSVLGGLTLLDTIQGDLGMPKIAEHVKGETRKAVLSFMGMMEHIHAKSYSSIFTTLCTKEEIDGIFQWVSEDQYLLEKQRLFEEYYRDIDSPYGLYLAMSASVMLESYLFYSGFFYPLYLAGQGKMTSSGEIIDLILRDESIHGLYVGMLAQEVRSTLTREEQDKAQATLESFFKKLHANELQYTNNLYTQVGLEKQVEMFIRYNANKAFMNLGIEIPFPDDSDEDINPIVLNGIKEQTKQHDFFSKKGNGYVRTVHVEELRDEDFLLVIE